ncbi:Selenide, water dikinase [compost metagenome]
MGVLSAAFKQGRLDEAGYAAMIASMTQLNTPGAKLSALPAVHAVTDVTGFGLLGHALEIARGSGVAVEIDPTAPVYLPGAADLAADGVRTGASTRNWTAYGASIRVPSDLPVWRRDLLTDPQTAGGLLISAAPDGVDAVMDVLQSMGFAASRCVGRVMAGEPAVTVGQGG